MFAGVSSIVLNEEETLVTGLSSKEGEEVVFKKPVSLKENPKVNEWLTCVESEMRTSLATLLASAVKEIRQYNTDEIDSNAYMGWVDKYQVNRADVVLK